MKKYSKEWARHQIMEALPINEFFRWYMRNYSGMGWGYWADEVLEMRDEGVVEIDKGKITITT